MVETLIVVPCYNERERLPVSDFLEFLQAQPGVGFLFVDDGSQDNTAELLAGLVARHADRCQLMRLEQNVGKAEAVRIGMLRGLDLGVPTLGFWDADLATPLEEIPRFVGVLEANSSLQVVLGARVALLGRRIERRPMRHYLGRVFATVASWLLSLPVYDTQCGAKLFRSGDLVRGLFAEPFLSRWIFDVELLARLVQQRSVDVARCVVYELPLQRWHDVPGSRLQISDFLRAGLELWRIRRRYLAVRSGAKRAEP